jgi:hypothetical protein
MLLLINYFKVTFLRWWLWMCDIIQNIGSFVLPFAFRASILACFPRISVSHSSVSFKSLRVLFTQQTNNEYNLWALPCLNFFPRRDMFVLLVLSYPCVLGFYTIISSDQLRGLVVRVSDYWSSGPGFDSRLYHGDFSLKGKIPIVTRVWVV